MTLASARYSQRQLWGGIVACLVALGVLFRLVNLDQAVYWVDEVATSIRVSGYTYAEVTQQLLAQQASQSLPLSVADLLYFQRIKSGSSLGDLLRVLSQSPEHAPLYFVLMRLWASQFGTTTAAMRSLSVVFSLLTLPAMGWACGTLFGSQARRGSPIVWTATGLLAVSPFFVAYAQEARPYSLWLLLLLLLLGTLWRSLQGGRRLWWLAYGVTLTLTLYTSLLTLFVLLGQGLAVMLFHPKRRRAYLAATGAALLSLLPWCWVVVTHWQVLQGNTVWMREPMPLWAIVGIWHYSLAVLFFDVPVATGRPLILGGQMAIAAGFVALMGYAACRLLRQTPAKLGGFLALGALATPAALLLIDLLRSGQAAATPRYLMPTQIGALIAVAYCLSDRLFSPSRRWRALAAVVLSVSLASCLIGVTHASNYQKSRNRSNPAIAAIINQTSSPQLVAEAEHIQDLISLSYGLEPDVAIYIVPPAEAPSAPSGDWLTAARRSGTQTFVFTPSAALKSQIEGQGLLQPVYQPVRLIPSELGLELWQLEFP